MKKVALAGSTGSIGCNSLEVIRNNPDKLKLVSISGGKNWQKLVEQAIEFKPEFVAIADESAYHNVKQALEPFGIKVEAGQTAVEEAACYSQANTLIAAIVGAAGLKPVMRAIEAGMDICLANKETLVVAGELVNKIVAQKKIALIPVDSEHSAIFQSIGNNSQSLAKLILTASGGPFRNYSVKDLHDVTPEQALKHPNWNMGGKITIDSATMMNKGLEVIEAHWLFNIDYQHIEVVVHPQSIIHSLVEFTDGSVLAQLGWPDMKLPIQYALSYPQRWGRAVSPLDLVKVGILTFEKPDYDKFPCLSLAFNAGKIGGIMPCVLNAANEIAVMGFLQKRTGFTKIADIVEKTMNRFTFEPSKSIDHLLQVDLEARKYAEEILESLS